MSATVKAFWGISMILALVVSTVTLTAGDFSKASFYVLHAYFIWDVVLDRPRPSAHGVKAIRAYRGDPDRRRTGGDDG